MADAARLPAGGALLGWGRVGLLLGHYPSWHAYLNPDPTAIPADLVLIGRWLSAVIGALTIPVTWRLGERLGPRGAGLLAALFMAVSFGPVRDAHWALIEALLLLGIVGTLLLVVRALEKPTLGRFALAAVGAGLAASAKYSGVTLAAPIALAVLLARRAEGRSVLGTLWDRRLLVAAALVVVAFLAGSPFMVVSRKEFMDSMAIREWSYRDASFGTAVGFIHHVVFSLRYSHGLAHGDRRHRGPALAGPAQPRADDRRGLHARHVPGLRPRAHRPHALREQPRARDRPGRGLGW